MSDLLLSVLLPGGICLIFFIAWLLSRGIVARKTTARAKDAAEEYLQEAQREAETARKEADLEAKERLYVRNQEFEKETRDKREELGRLEKKLRNKQEQLDQKFGIIDQKEKDLTALQSDLQEREQKVEKLNSHLEELVEDQRRQLENISGMTQETAKRELMRSMESTARKEVAKTIQRIEDEAQERARQRAKGILCTAMQRVEKDEVVEPTVTMVKLPTDEMKGRIIGREGRNIRALEMATGVDLIVDDTPEAVLLSGFDPLRRAVAKASLERLISDGRIHPARIEEVVESVRVDFEQIVRDEGESLVFDLGILDLHPEIVKALGMLRYRSAGGQNVLSHSREVSIIAGALAAELEVNAWACKRAGLLHDIGKALLGDSEGSHVQVGVELLQKYNESPKVIHAVEAHHNHVQPLTIEANLVQVANRISTIRPGPRAEMVDTFCTRMRRLEHIADSFKGVHKSFAIQAGREVRVLVDSTLVNDKETVWLSKDIAQRIETELEYPGQVRVNVIRETRASEFAK